MVACFFFFFQSLPAAAYLVSVLIRLFEVLDHKLVLLASRLKGLVAMIIQAAQSAQNKNHIQRKKA